VSNALSRAWIGPNRVALKRRQAFHFISFYLISFFVLPFFANLIGRSTRFYAFLALCAC